MNNLTQNKTYIALKNKSQNDDARMPSIQSIHNLLSELNINHYFDGESQNIFESRSGQKTYVTNRGYGKFGKLIRLRAFQLENTQNVLPANRDSLYLEMDSSNSYYSHNSDSYARDLIFVIDNRNNLSFTRN